MEPEFRDFMAKIQIELASQHEGYNSLGKFRKDFMDSNQVDPEIKAQQFGYSSLCALLESQFQEIREFVCVEKIYGEPPIVIYKARKNEKWDSICEAMKISEVEKQKKAQKKQYWREKNRCQNNAGGWKGRGQSWGQQQQMELMPQNRERIQQMPMRKANNGQRRIVQEKNCDEYEYLTDDEEGESQRKRDGQNCWKRMDTNTRDPKNGGIIRFNGVCQKYPEKDFPRPLANPCSTEFLRQFDKMNLDGNKMGEKRAAENKGEICAFCAQKNGQIEMLERENNLMFAELRGMENGMSKFAREAACGKCAKKLEGEMRKWGIANGNEQMTSRGSNDWNLSRGDGQFNFEPPKMSTPKSEAEIRMEMGRRKEKEFKGTPSKNQQISGFSSLISSALNAPLNLFRKLSFLGQNDTVPVPEENEEKEINTNPEMSSILNEFLIFETRNKNEKNGKKAMEREIGQRKVLGSPNFIFQQRPAVSIQKIDKETTMVMEKNMEKKNRREISEITVGSMDLEGEIWKADESDTDEGEEGDGGRMEEEGQENGEENETEEENEDGGQNEGREDENENAAPGTPNQELWCQICNLSFDTPKGLKLHKSRSNKHREKLIDSNIEEEEGIFPCSHEGCQSRLNSPALLKMHISRKHAPKFVCIECGRGYLKESGLAQHRREKGHE